MLHDEINRTFGILLMVISMVVPTARAFDIDSMTKPISLFASDASYQLKSLFMGLQAWVYLYIVGDVGYHDYLVSESDEMRAFHEHLNQKTIDSTCCKPSACIIDPSAVCTSVCEDCDEVWSELNQYYNE